MEVNKKGVYFAFRDQGACLSLLAIKVNIFVSWRLCIYLRNSFSGVLQDLPRDHPELRHLPGNPDREDGGQHRQGSRVVHPERGLPGGAAVLLLQERWHMVQLARGMPVHGWISGENIFPLVFINTITTLCRLTVPLLPPALNAQLGSTSQNKALPSAGSALSTAKPPSAAALSAAAPAVTIAATAIPRAALAPDHRPPRGMSRPPRSRRTR